MNYNTDSATKYINFEQGANFYLSVTLSNCTYNGNVWITDLSTLSDAIRDELALIPNLQFRGIGDNMVRGNHNALTIGIGASYYYGIENLTETQAIDLRTRIRNGVLNVSGLSFSEILIETAFVQSSTF